MTQESLELLLVVSRELVLLLNVMWVCLDELLEFILLLFFEEAEFVVVLLLLEL